MAQGPYAQLQQVTMGVLNYSHPPAGTIQILASDTPNLSAQTEMLFVRTQVAAPFPNHPQGAELAALLHVRSLIDAQIQAMQSP
jgi:hypothetical protein